MQDTGFVPRAWEAERQLYQTAVARDCRTCHAVLAPPLDFADAATFRSLAPLVTLGVEHGGGMPHARVTFENVPCFAVHLDAEIEVPELGRIKVDVAYGGMFYVIADADQLGLSLVPDEGGEIARAGEMTRAAARDDVIRLHLADAHCSQSFDCKVFGECSASPEWVLPGLPPRCVAGGDLHCRASRNCDLHGECTAARGHCW